jgi:hypothetical protein
VWEDRQGWAEYVIVSALFPAVGSGSSQQVLPLVWSAMQASQTIPNLNKVLKARRISPDCVRVGLGLNGNGLSGCLLISRIKLHIFI